MNRKLAGWLSCAAAVCTAGQAGAVGLAMETFIYPAGMPLPAMGGGAGWAGNWIGSAAMVATPPTLAYPIAQPSTGISLMNPTVGEGWRPFAGAITNFGSSVWASWMERTSGAGGQALVTLDPPAGAGFQQIVIYKDPLGAYQLASGGVMAPFVPGGGPGVTDFLVLHVHQFTGAFTTIDLYVNPTSTALVPGPSSTITLGIPYSLARFYYRSDGGQWLDEIRLGTTFPDVAAATGPCYPNCDGSTSSPCLNVNDFACFLNKFAAGDPYANCDGSTAAPILNVNDFACFLNKFAAGCSSC